MTDSNSLPTARDEQLQNMMDAWGDAVFRLALRRTTNKQDAEDIAQVVFLRYFQNPPLFTDDDHAKAWFLRVAMNCCNDYHRNAWNQRRRSLTDTEEAHQVDTASPTRVQEAVAALPEKQQIALHLFYEEGYTSDAIATITNEKATTVRSHLHRARAALRQTLGGSYDWN